MIRIIYSWKVESQHREAFIETWKRTTNSIHKEVEGALGSFMIQDKEDEGAIKTVARWKSLEDWQRFWKDSKPSQMRSMHDLGTRISVEVFQEIDDFTR